MTLSFVFEVAMLSTSVIGILVASWMLWRARLQRDLQALSGFAIMMAIWCLGHSALFHGFSTLGVHLILANPLMPTFFLHFATAFVKTGIVSPPWLLNLYKRLPWIYGMSIFIVLLSWVVGAGDVRSSDVMDVFLFLQTRAGLILSIPLLLVLLLMLFCYMGGGSIRVISVALFSLSLVSRHGG
ncbi:hypothetical protein O1D97_08875 [Marinomonas sp. 15G1-11]|uniref:Histidine kinase N-terminal 7TM region domain-containing protein n=1 Tax=Marinomonas phaeophyticola TaxID=3004091 RepID=A0ABT4JTS4_9GAMM|nr:hypothetical protein [Marinomonas sp. 15G1-11]MCZ2721762.1 hypothetical protein [Marinomonas sp. 15G1-11]